MKLIGLSGPAGVGKDTIADYLVETHGFVKFSFADALYREVAEAFGLTVAFLQDRTKKEAEQEALQYWYCRNHEFQRVMYSMLSGPLAKKYPLDWWCSPRQILQWWGTEYRRKQDPDYWVKQSDTFVHDWLYRTCHGQFQEQGPSAPGLIQTSVRFPNERAFMDRWSGEVWHVRREGWEKAAGEGAKHEAEAGLAVMPADKLVHNNGTIEQLNTIANLMLAAQPGSVYYCEDPTPAVEAVTCKACGYLHRAYSVAEAEAEIAAVNEFRKGTSGAVRESLDKHMPALAHYKACICCASVQFDPADAKLLGPMTPGVVYDPVREEADRGI